MAQRSGRHFLQIPGPSPVPDPVLEAIARPTIDHRGPEFGELGKRVLAGSARVMGAPRAVIFPSSGTGAWEAALVNTLSPGDEVLIAIAGQFAWLWAELVEKLGYRVRRIDGDWRRAVRPEAIAQALRADAAQAIKAVCVVHNETSTGAASDIKAVRRALDEAGHPALLLVDTISSLGSLPYDQTAMGVDVTVSCSQKGLMLPPGLGFNGIGPKALEASRTARTPRSYWDWQRMLDSNENGYFPSTPATNLLYGLEVALGMIEAEGLENVFARHERLASAARAAVEAWGLEILITAPHERSNVLTAVLVPDGHDADALRKTILDNYDMSLGTGLGRLKGRVFRIGHLGAINELTLMGALSGVEMGLARAGIPHRPGGVEAAMRHLEGRNA